MTFLVYAAKLGERGPYSMIRIGEAQTWAEANKLCMMVPKEHRALVYDDQGTLRRQVWAGSGKPHKKWAIGTNNSGPRSERRTPSSVARALWADWKARRGRRE